MKGDVTVMTLALIFAATAQDLWPALPLSAGKPPWLMAVALYYGAERGPGLAWVAAVLAGLWLDGLSGGPIGPSVLVLGLLRPLLVRLHRVFPAWSARVTVIGGACAAPALALTGGVGMRMAYGAIPIGSGAWMLRLLTAIPLGAATALVAGSALRGLDRVMGNVPLRKEIGAID